MSRRKADSVLSKLEVRRVKLKRKIDSSNIIADGVDSPFWKGYSKMFRDKLLGIERQLDYFEKLTHDQIMVLLTMRKDMRMFINSPKDFDADRRGLSDHLVKVDKYIKEWKEKHGG